MEKNRSERLLIIIILLVAVTGLSVGFATFSSALNIKAKADVTVPTEGSLNVIFLGTNDPSENVLTVDPTYGGTAGASGTQASINNGDGSSPVITNLYASFTKPNQTVTYTFYAKNAGQYTAYRKNIVFENVSDEIESKINCTLKSSSTLTGDAAVEAQEYINRACEAISVSVQVGSDTAVTGYKAYTGKSLPADDEDVSNRYEQVIVTISYGDGVTALDDFDVAIGDIIINYSSLDE